MGTFRNTFSGARFPRVPERTTAHNGRRNDSLAAYLSWLLVSTLILVSFSASASAQSLPTTPYVVTAVPLSTASKTQFFILGGFAFSMDKNGYLEPTPINQFIALDLTLPWNASQPVWTNIGPPRYQNQELVLLRQIPGSLVVSLDGKHINAFGGLGRVGPLNSTSFQYTFADKTWTLSPTKASTVPIGAFTAVQDPATGLAYVAQFGWDAWGRFTQDMYSFDIAKNNIAAVLMIPSSTPQGLSSTMINPECSVVYTAHRKSFLYLDTTLLTTPRPLVLTEYIPASDTWASLLIQGSGPSARTASCMASNEDGTKIVLFGGRLLHINASRPVFTNELWILDVTSMSWRRGPPAPEPRFGSACTIVNDTLINWGGFNGVATESLPILLFDLKTNTFVDQYKPTWPDTSTKTTSAVTSAGSTETATSTPTMSGNLDMNSDNKDSPNNQTTIIGGGAAGAVLLLSAAGAGFFFYRRKRTRRRRPLFQSREWSSTGDHDGDEALSSYEKRARYASFNSETIPMRAEFLEQERQKWRGSTTSQGYISQGGSPYDRMSVKKTASSIDPADAFKAGAAAALEASAISPRERELQLQILEAGFRERQSFIQAESQNARESALFRQSLNSSGVTRNSFGTGAPLAVAINPSPFKSSSQHQGQAPAHQGQAQAQYQGQRWSTPLSPVTSLPQQHQGDQHRQSMQLMHLQEQQLLQQQQQQQEQHLLHQLQVQQAQQGLASPPPPLNYNTRP
ncbi:hypothetical protein EMPS_00320 [Entomortierella parvispora]|uniref:Uncharacterized protein n=1 Tax=Entomortierella parvispora TaxID=205924 RepID=A0A9P3LRL2_9FUNG|nr:hypothetical protein EMPS_00320 [Entomortierella parvispora]